MVTRARQIQGFVVAVLRMLSRDPTAAFFMLFLPILIIVIVGSAFGGQRNLRVGLMIEGETAEGSLTELFVDAFDEEDAIELTEYDSVDAMRSAIRQFDLDGGVVVNAGFADLIAAGEPAIGVVALPASNAGFVVESAAQGAIDRVRAVTSAGAAVAANGEVSDDEGREMARSLDIAPTVEVDPVNVSGDREMPSRFALTAPQNLVLFTFINALTAATALVVIRRDHVLARAMAAPVSTGTVVAGLGIAWLSVALFQSVLILVIGSVFFGVDWGDPLAGALLLVVFAAVGASAGLLVGAVGREVDRVGATTPIMGIALAALGGCMMPLEIFPPTMLAIAHAIPHYWAMQAWETLIFDAGGVGDITDSLVVLFGFAVVLFGGATLALRRDVSRGGLT